jgi:hypothetical protein
MSLIFRLFIFQVTLSFSLYVQASACDDMKIRYNDLKFHADNYAIKESRFSVSPHVLGRSEREACAIMEFSVDDKGVPYDARVVEYFPGKAVGESAILYINKLRFKNRADNKYYYYVYYNKLSMSAPG